MKKIKLLLILTFFVTTSLWSQLALTLQVPQAGVLLKPQLWNAVVVNSYPASKQVYIGLTLSDVTTGNPVMTALTSHFTVNTGSFQVQESTVSPISYDYLSSDITNRDPDGYLPAGNYSACFTLFEIQEAGAIPVTEQCMPLIVEPVSPPILNTPFNQEVIYNPFPQFTWIPPAPLEIFSYLNYDFILVEVQDGQNYADAIEQNLPVYAANLPDAFLNYPASAISLDTGKTYAWRVIAKNNQQYAAQSEIWTFSVKDTGWFYRQSLSAYTKLKRTLDASMSVSVKNLQVYYENDASDSSIVYTIYKIDPTSGSGGTELLDSGRVDLFPGANLIDLPPDKLPKLEDGKQYLFQLYNSRNEFWNMKFIYYKSEEKTEN